MFRRSFLGALGGLPLLGFLKPRGERKTWFFLDEYAHFPKRGSSRTMRALGSAVELTDVYPAVCLLVYSQSEANRLVWKSVRFWSGRWLVGTGENSGWRSGVMKVNGERTLYIRSVELNGWRGMRAHYVLDHSLKDFMPVDKYRELLENLKYAHVGPALA